MGTKNDKLDLDLDEIEKLAGMGLTIGQVAHNLGVSRSTLDRRREKFAEVDEALKRGKDVGIKKVVNKVFDMAIEGNVACAIFFLKARAGWKEGDSEVPMVQPIINYISPGRKKK